MSLPDPKWRSTALKSNRTLRMSGNYGFDPLNRISTAGALTFDIDRTANRWHQNPTGEQISFDPATNRIASGNGVTYDAAGNITNDGMHSFTYDAEGRIVSADAGSIAYTYDRFRAARAQGGKWISERLPV